MPELAEDLRRLLDHFERRIDPDHVARVRGRYQRFLQGAPVAPPPLTCYVRYEGSDFTPYPVRETIDNPERMLVNELLMGFTSLYHALDRNDDTPYVIRPNLGTGIVASMFGAPIELLGDNPPWARPLGGIAAIERVVDAPLPDVTAGLGRQMCAHYAFFHDVLAGYPRCAAACDITLPDLQGPFDTAELLWGSRIYVALRRQPDLVRKLLDKVTQQMVRVWHVVEPLVSDTLMPLGNFQHATAVKGRLLIRNDSSVLISPEMYADIVREYDARLAAELGAAIHFCGDGTHQIENLITIPGVQGLDFGQADMMDIAAIYARTLPLGIPLSRVRLSRDALCRGIATERYPRLASLCYAAQDVADAQAVCADYYRHANADVGP